MAKFPDAVITAMHHAGTTMTCLPVRLDDQAWQSALYFVLPESIDNEVFEASLAGTDKITVALDADLHEMDSATIISLGLELHLNAVHGTALKPAGEVLFFTGHLTAHFENVKLLATQPGIPLFVGDRFCELLHQQIIPLSDEHRSVLAQLLSEAASRDALIRFRGQYDPDAAFAAYAGSGYRTVQ